MTDPHDSTVGRGSLLPSNAAFRQNDAVPGVFAKGGQAHTTSRDVADFFGKRHDNLLRDIDALIREEPSLSPLKFEETPFVDPQNGQTYRRFNMNRDGFVLLVMSFTGRKALNFKISYIDAFNQLEDRLRKASAPFDLDNPEALRQALMAYADKAIVLKAENAALQSKAKVLDLIATSSGSLSLTATAKLLAQPPKTFIAFLCDRRWIYRAAGAGHLGYQDKLNAGLIEHKAMTFKGQMGGTRLVQQVLVRPKGVARLAELLTCPPVPASPANENLLPLAPPRG